MHFRIPLSVRCGDKIELLTARPGGDSNCQRSAHVRRQKIPPISLADEGDRRLKEEPNSW
jgi:hypothetical protein